jgi:cellulose synthase/poly-beta-1,6-N-acetylglucosamine synthase-like glycosyltransferase
MQMAKRVRLLAQPDQSHKACTINLTEERTRICPVDEISRQTRKLCKTIVKLESEKRTLLDEKRTLETKALRGWTHMNPRQTCALVMLGIVMTAMVILVPPFFVDPLVSRSLPLSTLDEQTKLVSYLREVQACQNVFLAVHGYDHKCPIDGSNAYELTCPHGQIPLEEIKRRIEAGIEIFKKCGLEVDSYAFPGQDYDERALSVLSNYTPTPSVYNKTKLEGLGLTANSSLTDLIVYYGFREYTWMWRDDVSEKQFQDALNQLYKDKPTLLLLHVQDITNQTLDLLKYAILQANTGIIRIDDIAFDSHAQATKQVVDLATKYNVSLFLAVIPASPSAGSPNSYLSDNMFKALLAISTSLFVFPTVVMTPWALIFKTKKRKPYAKWNPHYPMVSIILPAYNEEKTIAKSIERSLSQRYKGSIEIIVIDDGSTDRTYDIAKTYADKHANVMAIRLEKNRGKSHALNMGFAQAKGEISVFSDTDSILAPEAISRMVSHFKDPDVGMVAGMVVIGNEKNLLTRLQQIEYLLSQSIIRFCQSSQKNVLICPGACTAVRTDIASKIPVTDRTITEDADFTFSVWKEGWKICQEPESVSYTEAPGNLRSLITQRKRWLYGSLQTIAIHKWAAREGNPWVLKAWLECFLSPFALLFIVSLPLQYFFLGNSFPLFLLTYGLLPLAILGISGAIGVRLFNRGEKSKLAFLMPLYAAYQLMMNLLLVYLVFAFISRKGIHLMRGGKIIHAI